MPRHDFWDERRRGNFRCDVIDGSVEEGVLAPISGDPRLSPDVELTVFYNGACAICRRRVTAYQSASAGRSRLIAWCDVARSPWALQRWRIDGEVACGRLHVVDAKGRLYGGARAFARLWRELPGYCWLGYLLAAPGLGGLSELVYRAIVSIRIPGRGIDAILRGRRHA